MQTFFEKKNFQPSSQRVNLVKLEVLDQSGYQEAENQNEERLKDRHTIFLVILLVKN